MKLGWNEPVKSISNYIGDASLEDEILHQVYLSEVISFEHNYIPKAWFTLAGFDKPEPSINYFITILDERIEIDQESISTLGCLKLHNLKLKLIHLLLFLKENIEKESVELYYFMKEQL